MVAMILVVLGMISFSRLGLDFFPDLEFPTVSVITTYRGVSSEDIEKSITRPLEQLVSSVNRSRSSLHTTSEGVSVIMIEFEWGTNLDFAAQDMRDQIGLYEQFLPKGRRSPGVEVQPRQMPIVFWASPANLPPRAQGLHRRRCRPPPGAHRRRGRRPSVFSLDTREIQVAVDKTALESPRPVARPDRRRPGAGEPQPAGRPHGRESLANSWSGPWANSRPSTTSGARRRRHRGGRADFFSRHRRGPGHFQGVALNRPHRRPERASS